MIFKNYNMWWAQSMSGQGFYYAPFKQTTHTFKGRTLREAEKKMRKFLSMAQITGRFVCVEEWLRPEMAHPQNPVHMLKEQLVSLETVEAKIEPT